MFVRARRWPFRIGRDPRNDLCLAQSEKVSRLHARITQQEGRHQLIVSGQNPTFLNGEPVPLDKPLPLTAGDVIELPDYRLEIQEISAGGRAANSTVMLKAIADDNYLIRLVASRLGLGQWTLEEILAWLQARPGREIMIRQGHYQLCLMGRLDLQALQTRLELFADLQRDQDPGELSVEIINAGLRAS